MSRYYVQCGWDEVPHLSAEVRAELWASIPPYQRRARSEGIPELGKGAIYPIPVADITVPDFVIPKHWPRVFGMDVGWNNTAVVWAAKNPETGTAVLYDGFKRGLSEPAVHVDAIHIRGKWIPGVCDPASTGSSQHDGRRLLDVYREKGLNLQLADNAVEAGLLRVWGMLSTGKLKVFASMAEWFAEYSMYRRGEGGKIVKEHDHLMDACVVADTLVVTSIGPQRIADLVGTSGWVLSREGVWAKYFGARMTIRDAAVVTVTFEDGARVVCTPDHPFLTPDGWVRADALTGQFCYNAVSQRIQTDRFVSRWCQRPFRSLKAVGTTCAASISSVMAYGYTALCGRRSMEQPFQKVSMSTIGTMTAPIISPTILSYSPERSTSPITYWGTAVRSQRQQGKPLACGTNQMQGVDGIASTQKEDLTSADPFSVSTAGSRLRRWILAGIASVQTPAKPGSASRLGWTMWNALVWSAARCLRSIAICLRKSAHASVAVRCLGVVDEGQRSDVYCLTVPALHSFAIANGLVVHNTRYLVMSGLELAIVMPNDQPTRPDEYEYQVGNGMSTLDLGWLGQ